MARLLHRRINLNSLFLLNYLYISVRPDGRFPTPFNTISTRMIGHDAALHWFHVQAIPEVQFRDFQSVREVEADDERWRPSVIPVLGLATCRGAPQQVPGIEDYDLAPVGHRLMEPSNQHVPHRVVEPVSIVRRVQRRSVDRFFQQIDHELISRLTYIEGYR